MMSSLADVSLCEAVSSLGECAAETALLWRAGVTNVALSRFIDAAGERIRMCCSPALSAGLIGDERLVELATLALSRLHRRCHATGMSDKVDLLCIALPERFATDSGGKASPRGDAFVASMRARLPSAWSAIDIESFAHGRAGGAPALRRSIAVVQGGGRVVWGGVDSYHDWPALDRLARADRLLSVDNVDGVRPGEGAAFALLEQGGAADVGLGVVAVGMGREPHPIGSSTPSSAMGLTRALEEAVVPLRRAGRRCDHWVLDHTHERYATQQLQNIIARFGDVIGLQAALHMPLKELGDVGAAALPMLTSLAVEAWRLGHADDDVMLLTASSDDGARGAMLLAGRPRRAG